MPKLSIIVPIYNVEQYLTKCINSILSQTFTDFELILVDDGSLDRCPQICDDYAAQDNRIVVIHKTNGGLSDARNAGLDIAKGVYIGFVDSDDWIDPKMYEDMLNHAETTEAEIVVCGIKYCDERNNIVCDWQNISQNQTLSRDELLQNFFPYLFNNIRPAVWNKVYKREIFNNLRFPIGVLYEDIQILLDILTQSNRITLLKNYYYNYLATRTGSLMHLSFSQKQFSILDAEKKHYKFFLAQRIPSQASLALERYTNEYIKHFLVVYSMHRDLLDYWKPYKKEFPVLRALSCGKICEMKRLVLMLLYLSPTHALSLCQKYFPECLHPTLNQEC